MLSVYIRLTQRVKGQMGQTNDRAQKRSGKPNGRPLADRYNDVKFVQYELDKVEAEQCKAWTLNGDDAWNEMLPLLDEGYSFSIKFDGYSNSYACFIQIRGVENHPNTGLILSGRGSTPHKAVKQAIFKHRAIDATWLPYVERRYSNLDD